MPLQPVNSTPIPPNETLRLAALHRYDILDTLPEPVFDDLTRLASHLCAAPIAVITLVDEKRLWFKSRIGLPVDECPRDAAPCASTILGHDLFTIDDAPADERFAAGPLVIGEPR